MTEKNQVKEAYPPKKEEKCQNFCIFTQSFALLLGFYLVKHQMFKYILL